MIQKGSINKCARTHKESTPNTIFANPLLYNSEGSIYTRNSISTNSLHYNSKGLSKTHTHILKSIKPETNTNSN